MGSLSTVGARQGMAARTPLADVRDEQCEQARPDLIDFCFWDFAAITVQASQQDGHDTSGP